VQFNPDQSDAVTGFPLRKVAVTDIFTLNDRHAAFAHDFESMPANDDRALLIKAYPNDLRIMRDRCQQPAMSSSLRKMRIDHAVRD